MPCLCLQLPNPQTINTIMSFSFSTHQRKKLPLSSSTYCRIIRRGTNHDLPDHQYFCKPNRSSNCLVIRLRLAGACAAAGSDDKEKLHQMELPARGSLETELIIPKHVAVIMDGNRRWAVNKGYPVQVGHRAGGEALKRLILSCRKFGVQVLTVFAFSTENWRRPKEEVEYLMKLFEESIGPRINLVDRSNDGRVSVIGNRSRLPESLQNLISAADEVAKDDRKGPHLVVACNYSGRYDIIQASKKIAAKVRDGALQVEDIDERVLEQHLQTYGVEFPNPDLMIRTSGELRLSNFMLWQMAHTHLFFSNKLFPDFDEADFVQAIAAFQRTQTYIDPSCAHRSTYQV